VLDEVARRDATGARAHTVIERQVQHLGRLVEDLLDVGRVSTGKITLSFRALDLGALVAGVVAAWRDAGRLDAHRVTVAADPVWVRADETRFEQVVVNLLGNAVKFTPAGGAIELRVRADGGDAVLEVEDTGVGIPAELGERVFDLFVQGERALGRGEGGLGIGLTLVRRLAEQHGGTAAVHSRGADRGSRFTVRIPAIEPPPRAMESAAENRGPRPRRILLVEDHDDAREMLRVLLERDGHRVFAAATGDDGVALASASAPDLALIDVGLPGIDGYEVARRIRESGRLRIPLIALTGYGQPDDRRRAEDAGFDFHLVKPIDAARLGALIANLSARE
jgi:CheY-like chemotaxis protein